ncbi:hypothetical protein L195_g055133 [Trifolium pratense]|uniref:Uncharacterized protein n=1 Tax=Trifolium pratense TaxID=57577 RepID=A0A2K3KJQ9_TRIPR|nr:hypothetical protein L195_g055133 [Trifolium pratense]
MLSVLRPSKKRANVDISNTDMDFKGEAGVDAGLEAECAVRPSKKRANQGDNDASSAWKKKSKMDP